MTPSSSGKFAGDTGAISFHAGGKLIDSVCPAVDCEGDAGASALVLESSLSATDAIRTGLSVLAHNVGSSVRARCRSWYHAATALPRSFASRPREMVGVVLSLSSS